VGDDGDYEQKKIEDAILNCSRFKLLSKFFLKGLSGRSKEKFTLPGHRYLRERINKKGSKKRSLLFCISLHYFLPPLTLAIIKMINAIKPTTKKMPHTIPALKIPSTTEQLLRQRTKKQAREKINNLIPFFSLFNQNAYLFLFK